MLVNADEMVKSIKLRRLLLIALLCTQSSETLIEIDGRARSNRRQNPLYLPVPIKRYSHAVSGRVPDNLERQSKLELAFCAAPDQPQAR